jgi:hypothetical protein
MTLHRTPTWAITNSVLLFAPIVIGFGAFPSMRLWFIPSSTLWLYALLVFFFYYTVVFYIGKRLSGMKTWRLPRQGTRGHIMSALGLIMFSSIAYQAFYRVAPAIATSIAGERVKKEFTISSVDGLNPSGRCGTEVRLVEVSPSPLGKGFCIQDDKVDTSWAKGTRVTLSGRESALGFRVTRIGR